MKITTEPLEDRQLSLVIEVDEERTQQAMQRAAREISKEVNVPGFRKGKAPYSVIVQRFGEDTVRREAADRLADQVYAEALEQEHIEPYAPGVLQDMQLNPMTFTLTIPLQPKVELGDYHSYRREFDEPTVSEEQVVQALENLREEHAYFEPVERPAALGDGVTINLVAHAPDGAEVLKGEDIRIILEAGSTDPAPGFVEEIVGMEAGEERSFTLTLTPDFPQEAYRGEQAEFAVKVTEVYNYIQPELDDDLARATGNYESFEELEREISEALRTAAEQQAEREYAELVVSDIAEQAEIEYPPVMLEQELDELVREVEQSVRREARLSLEDYVRIQGKTLEQLREEQTPRAQDRLRRGLVLNQVVEREGLDVQEGEVATHIDEVSAPWGSRAEQVRASLETERGRKAVSSRLLANKAVELLITIAKGEADESTAGESEAEDAETEEPVEPVGEMQEQESQEPAAESEEEA